jgi:hypothetical protein
MDVGEPVGVALPPPPEVLAEPEPSLKAKWGEATVAPNHNKSWPPKTPPSDPGRVPAEARARMIVRTKHVPAGTSATITVHHCHSGALVKDGKVTGLEVRANRVIDPKTKAPPIFVFEDKHKVWDPWDKPFFFFKVEIAYKGLKGETPKDYKGQPSKVLRVKYWYIIVADAKADTTPPYLTTRAEMHEIAFLIGSKKEHRRAHRKAFNQMNLPVNLWGSVMRNSYAYHHASHGDIVDRVTGAQISQGNCPTCGTVYVVPLGTCPLDGATLTDPNPPTVPVGTWRSVVVLGQTNLGDNEVNQAGDVPSVPRYLVYMDTCVAGWEPSLANAFIGRGTQNYLAFRMYIPDRDARVMARKFYKKWIKTHKGDPGRIAPVYWDVGSPFYGSMQPVLMGPGGGSIHQLGAINALNKVLSGLLSSLGFPLW